MACNRLLGVGSLPRHAYVRPASTRKSLRLHVEARRTVSGKNTDSGVDTKRQQQGAERRADWTPDPQPQPRPSQRQTKKPQPWVFADGALLLGDMVMLAATEVSSERIPYEALPLLTGVTVVCWVAAAASLGDYRGEMPTSDSWALSILGPSYMWVVDATLTWGLSVTASLFIFSALVSSNVLDAAIMVEEIGSEELAPQLEVAVAGLIIMACWRGIVARLRWR